MSTPWMCVTIASYRREKVEGAPAATERGQVSRGMHGITFEFTKVVQQERTRANKLLAKAADAVLREHELRLIVKHRKMGHVAVERVRTVREHRLHHESDEC